MQVSFINDIFLMFYFFSMDLLDELTKELEENIESEKTKTHTLQMENNVCLKKFFKVFQKKKNVGQMLTKLD